MSYFNDCSDGLNSLAYVSFRFRPKSDEWTRQKGALLAGNFEKLSFDERNVITEKIASGLDKKLLALSGFMAEAAINTKNASLIKCALILHVMEGFRIDYRENIRYLVLIEFAAKRLGVNFPSVVDSVTNIASHHAKQHLVDFAARDVALNMLSSFGIKEEMNNGVFRFSPLS